MNERDLKYFCSLVETGNYTATATKFHVTQPAISAALRRLEEEYQAVLLTQANHRAQLVATAAGLTLYIKSKQLLKDVAQMALEVYHANEQQVRLGFSNVAGGIWLPRVIKKFISVDLLDQVTTTVADSEQLLVDLRQGKLDAAVFSTLVPERATDLRVSILEEHQMQVLANVNSPLSHLKTIRATDLQGVPIIARPKHALPRLALEQYCQRGHIQPKIVYEAATNALVEGLVAQNVGVGVVIADSVVLSDQVVGISLAAQEQLHCYMQLAVRKSFLPNANQQRCIDVLRQIRRAN
ncbi:LysR family transcriptional regulator [Lactiplantibacillus plantarum]|uniref:LysR family transcriptional regulator n=1 Tax=Lactiplantibacillus plantarum TaxID=1590 RepID=UPI002739293B|nr:LysR family transcriptional regulator [Lactiplantibacillus plantarum]